MFSFLPRARFMVAVASIFVANTLQATPIELSAEGMDFVFVGAPGNPADMRFGEAGRGAVSYGFSIGKYEVTVAQWADFLNSVAKSDSGTWYINQTPSFIARAGFSGSYRYESQPFKDRLPMQYVTWAQAARFANWMHNGRVAGSTESGVYDMTSGLPTTRNPDARFWIPSLDEWHKAAYYNGDNSSPRYWSFATQTDETPQGTVVDAFYEAAAGGVGNAANYGRYSAATWAFPALTASVGTAGGANYFGAFDMSGNIGEIVGFSSQIYGPYNRWDCAGGDYLNSLYYLQAGSLNGTSSENPTTSGFRIATAVVPEPTALSMLTAGLGTLLAALIHGRKVRLSRRSEGESI